MQTRLIKGVAQVQPDQLKLCLITDLQMFPRDRHLEVLEAALDGGVRDIQLREKQLSVRDFHSLAIVFRRMTERYRARLIINDRLDVALMVGADGVHLPENGLLPGEVKACYPHLIVGTSTHSLKAAREAEAGGADYITFSPVFDTPSKREYGPPQGLDRLAEVTGAVKIPVLALGGINLENLPDVLRRGAHGVALIRGIWNSDTIKETSSQYIQAFRGEPL
ncbi:MAG: thiamine phosphate synthase [Nitrospina sp.]|nr:thiamine phosphate synthase [Nitrospina sp.]